MEHLSNGNENRLNQHKNSHELYNESCFEFDGMSVETEATNNQNFPTEGQHCTTNTSVTYRNRSKRTGL